MAEEHHINHDNTGKLNKNARYYNRLCYGIMKEDGYICKKYLYMTKYRIKTKNWSENKKGLE